MREATGYSLLLYMLIPIIFLIITFVAFIMQYASAYRAANYIITQIETCDGTLNSGGCNHANTDSVREYVKSKFNYYGSIVYNCTGNAKGSVWEVRLQVEFDIPLLGNIGVFPLKSESKTLYNTTCPSVRTTINGKSN